MDKGYGQMGHAPTDRPNHQGAQAGIFIPRTDRGGNDRFGLDKLKNPARGQQNRQSSSPVMDRIDELYNKLNVQYNDLKGDIADNRAEDFDLEKKIHELESDLAQKNKNYVSHIKEDNIRNRYRTDFDEMKKQYEAAINIVPEDYKLEDERFVENKFNEQAKVFDPIQEDIEDDSLPRMMADNKQMEYGAFMKEILEDIYGNTPDSPQEIKRYQKDLSKACDSSVFLDLNDVFKNQVSLTDPAVMLMLACSEDPA